MSELFSRLHVYYYISIKNQIEMLFKKKTLPITRSSSNNASVVEDVKDGQIYLDFLDTLSKNNTNFKNVYTFTLNTDGICLCEKSNLSIWPVFFAINELDVENRFYLDNIIIAGNYNNNIY